MQPGFIGALAKPISSYRNTFYGSRPICGCRIEGSRPDVISGRALARALAVSSKVLGPLITFRGIAERFTFHNSHEHTPL